ncbi:hypothetical protein [Nocardiopsis sp. YSL2]|uniref:hypothetical protein n=1 Tax=Nocardiopsis sp. YSL2 TaxID=2939492 RepID=UPI0026F4628A|nr:hypothetical protein [Nocardiopsis sp. YSL2]
MTVFALTFGSGLLCGAAVLAAFIWFATAARQDQKQIELYHLRNENRGLREVNTKLSIRCGHCGTGRAVPADRQTGGTL